MHNWKPWQQFVFLGYLFLLNAVVLGSLAYLVFTTDEISAEAGPVSAADVAAVSPTPTSQLTATAVRAAATGPADNSQPGLPPPQAVVVAETDTPIPPVHILPVPVPTPTGRQVNNLPEPAPTAEQLLAAAPVLPAATSTPTSPPTATYTSSPQPTPTYTATPSPTATATTPPTATPTPQPTPTSTPRPAATATPTGTPRPSPTRTSSAGPTATPRPLSTATSTSTPTVEATKPPTPSRTPSPLPTSTPQLNEPATPPVAVAALVEDTRAAAEDSPAVPVQPGASDSDVLKAVPLTNASIALNWLPAEKAAEYRIYSDMGSGYGLYVHKAKTNEAAFIDEMLRPGMTYSYRITRLESGQEVVVSQADSTTFGNETTAGIEPPGQSRSATIRVTPAPTALPPDAVLLGLRSDNNFTDNFNVLTVVGEVRNDSNLDVGQTDIAVTFYDAVGAVIGTANGQTMLDVIPPGEISPFIITLTRPSGLASYSLRAVARPVTAGRNAQLAVIEVKRYEDDAGFFHVRGVIENTGNITAKRTKVAAVLYGRDNRVINVGFTYTSPPTLPPGGRATYDVIFTYYPRYVAQTVIPFEE